MTVVTSMVTHIAMSKLVEVIVEVAAGTVCIWHVDRTLDDDDEEVVFTSTWTHTT